MNLALVFSALALGWAGSPHCTLMCGAACAAVVRRDGWWAQLGFHLARLASYAAAGAVVAATVDVLGALGRWSPALRPLWTLVHAGALMLGLWLVWHGRQPAWLASWGRTRHDLPDAQGWQRLRGPARATLAGSLWAAWPCGLLQSALVVAALANGPAGGALVMAAFGASSALGLVAAPWLWARWGGGGAAAGAGAVVWGTRAAGLMLVLASGWALGHGLWSEWLAYCAT